jgi:hypothetical protein
MPRATLSDCRCDSDRIRNRSVRGTPCAYMFSSRHRRHVCARLPAIPTSTTCRGNTVHGSLSGPSHRAPPRRTSSHARPLKRRSPRRDFSFGVCAKVPWLAHDPKVTNFSRTRPARNQKGWSAVRFIRTDRAEPWFESNLVSPHIRPDAKGRPGPENGPPRSGALPGRSFLPLAEEEGLRAELSYERACGPPHRFVLLPGRSFRRFS